MSTNDLCVQAIIKNDSPQKHIMCIMQDIVLTQW